MLRLLKKLEMLKELRTNVLLIGNGKSTTGNLAYLKKTSDYALSFPVFILKAFVLNLLNRSNSLNT